MKLDENEWREFMLHLNRLLKEQDEIGWREVAREKAEG